MLNSKSHVLSFNDAPIDTNSPIDSVAYNNIIDSLKGSVLRTINRTRELNKRVEKLNKALIVENEVLNTKIQALGMDTTLNDDHGSGVLITGFKDILDGSINYNQNILTGQITVSPFNGRKWSKVIRYSDANLRKIVSKDTTIILDGDMLPIDSDIYNILDGYNDTFWLLDTTQGATHTIIITFPISIKPFVNYLSLIPFPAFSYDIQSVLVKQANGVDLDITTYLDKKQGIIDSHFKPVSWGNQITINIKANHNVIGISDLDIGLINYSDSATVFTMKIDELKSKSISAINYIDIENFYLNGTFDISWNKFESLSVSVSNDNTTWVDIATDTLKGDNPTEFGKNADVDFYIKFSFNKYLGQSPVFNNVKLYYEE